MPLVGQSAILKLAQIRTKTRSTPKIILGNVAALGNPLSVAGSFPGGMEGGHLCRIDTLKTITKVTATFNKMRSARYREHEIPKINSVRIICANIKSPARISF